MALAYAWILSLGAEVIREPALQRRYTRGKKSRLSVYRLGIRYLLDQLAHGVIPKTVTLLVIDECLARQPTSTESVGH